MMQVTVQFEEYGIEFDCGPADAELNVFYQAAAIAIIRPHTLAAALNRIPEEKARDLMARAMAEGCIFDSRPEMSSEERYAWLIAHPNEADHLRSVVEHRPNFVGAENGATEEHPKTDEPPRGPDRTGGRFPRERNIL